MNYFSTFSGIGGFELGLNANGHNCVGYSEIDKRAISIYKHKFPDHINYGDITKIDAEKLPDFDILCGGFPCQPFSTVGLQLGEQDIRGTLFWDIARILQVKKPKYVFLENVRGLLSNNGGRTFWKILNTLDELGMMLNGKFLTANTLEPLTTDPESLLLDTIDPEPAKEYFLLPDNYPLTRMREQFLVKFPEQKIPISMTGQNQDL